MWKKQKGRVNEGFGMKGQAGRETETASLQKKGELYTSKYGFQRNTPPKVL